MYRQKSVSTFFKPISNQINTDVLQENSGRLFKIPKVKLKVAKNRFFFMGSKQYNELPLEIRKETLTENFRRKMKKFYL